jgi:hypothetical protein
MCVHQNDEELSHFVKYIMYQIEITNAPYFRVRLES